jgi:hypothetical protein
MDLLHRHYQPLDDAARELKTSSEELLAWAKSELVSLVADGGKLLIDRAVVTRTLAARERSIAEAVEDMRERMRAEGFSHDEVSRETAAFALALRTGTAAVVPGVRGSGR